MRRWGAMAYSFRQDDATVADGLRRIARDQIEAGLAEIGDDGLPPAERIHQVRKRCKKLRGLIRLVRPSFDAYDEENATFRDIARRLSDVRDAAALVEICDALAAHYEDVLDVGALRPLRERLASEAAEVGRGDDVADRLAACREELLAARARAAEWQLDAEEWEAVSGGLEKTFGRARRAMAKARAAPDETTTHEWRKRVKYHRYHARLFSRMDDTLLPGHVELASRLSGTLGEHHDLHVLEDRLDGLDLQSTPEVREAVVGLMRERRHRLEARAFALGRRLLTEKPGHLGRRWRPLWQTWRSGNA